MPERTCSVDGCNRPHRARGLCSTCYNQRHQPARHRKVRILCGWCARPTDKARDTTRGYQQRFCSLTCRDTWRQRDKLPVIYVGQRSSRPAPPATSTPPPRHWAAGQCRCCGAPFVDRQTQARFCSALCNRRYWRKLYTDDVPAHVRRYVLMRDRWQCKICMRPINRSLTVPDPRAGTVDHVIPQSQGGTHDVANLRAAHMSCNSARNNRGGNEQLALIG